jgi:hypothetical protein
MTDPNVRSLGAKDTQAVRDAPNACTRAGVSLSHYLFLGRGDYLLSSVPLDQIDVKWRRPAEVSTNPADWTFSWGPDTWRRKLDRLKELGSQRIYLLMNGFELPYPSRMYPRLVEPDHANVAGDFLQSVIDHAAGIGLEVVAGLSTTGHCDRALQEYPELAGVHADGRRWQCAMCHNHPGAQDYVRVLLDEVLDRYHGFSGVFLHPPEVGEYCHCSRCTTAYQAQTGKNLMEQESSAVMSWFWGTGMSFLATLYGHIREREPSLSLHTCSIPSVWRHHFDAIGPLLPNDVNLIHWHYGRLDESARTRITDDLRIFTRPGHRVAFANSVIFACSGMTDDELRANNHAKNQLAQSLGVKEIVYFVGPVWQEARIVAGSVRPEESLFK